MATASTKTTKRVKLKLNAFEARLLMKLLQNDMSTRNGGTEEVCKARAEIFDALDKALRS